MLSTKRDEAESKSDIATAAPSPRPQRGKFRSRLSSAPFRIHKTNHSKPAEPPAVRRSRSWTPPTFKAKRFLPRSSSDRSISGEARVFHIKLSVTRLTRFCRERYGTFVMNHCVLNTDDRTNVFQHSISRLQQVHLLIEDVLVFLIDVFRKLIGRPIWTWEAGCQLASHCASSAASRSDRRVTKILVADFEW